MKNFLNILTQYCLVWVIISLGLPVFGQQVQINLKNQSSDWQVSPYIFGRFFELNGRDTYPGFISQHLANNSFEPWNAFNNRHIRDEIIFHDVEAEGNLAYPWQSTAEMRPKVWFAVVKNGIHGQYFQRIINPHANNRVGIYQKTALPDERTLDYQITFHARAFQGEPELTIALTDSNQQILTSKTMYLSSQWQQHQIVLTLPHQVKERFENSPFGIYQLAFTFSEEAMVDIDHVLLQSADAVEGMFNPTTLNWMEEFNVTTLRWPGGNYASMYRWTDAIGPWQQRPVSTNDEWGGLEPNYFGTNEFLQFCKISNVEPYINAPFNLDLASPEYLAQWVEYVNGDTTTEMGKLRKQHGYPEPWRVKLWQIGNEHYGTYQAGHVQPQTYAVNIRRYVNAMKQADPSIQVMVSGADPMYTDHKGDEWNQVLLQNAGDAIDGVDIHRYVNWFTIDKMEFKNIDPWLKGHMYVAFPSQYEKIVSMLTDDFEKYNQPALEITVGEWNLSEVVVGPDKIIDYPTMPHAAFVAGMYNTFIKKGQWVKYAHQRDNTLYFRPYAKDFRPVNPGAYVLQMYSEPFQQDKSYQLLDMQLKSPGFAHPALGQRFISMEDVPYVDAVSVISEDRKKVYIFMTNRRLKSSFPMNIKLPKSLAAATIKSKELATDNVFSQQKSWDKFAFEMTEQEFKAEKNNIKLDIKPSAVIRLEISLK